MTTTNTNYKLTSLNEEKISEMKKTKIEKKKSKSFLKFSIVKNAIVAITAFVTSNPITEYFALRLQDIVGIEIYEALGRNAFDTYSRISNAILAEPMILALGITGISIVGDLVVFTIKKTKEHHNKKKLA